jgi:hypothetical protein
MTDAAESSFQPIEIDGIFLGAVVPHALGVSFIAADRRVAEMDKSIWPTLGYARSAVAQLYRDVRPPGVKWSWVKWHWAGRLSRLGSAVVRWMARCARTALQAGE